MLKDVAYDKVKLLKELCSLAWFLKQHAVPNAKKAKDTKALKLYQGMEKDIGAHLSMLEKMVKSSK